MEKSITITVTDEGHKMEANNMNNHEVLGLLRFYEKYIWLRMAEHVNNDSKSTTTSPTENSEVKNPIPTPQKQGVK